jgi:O-antigen ligase
LNKDRTYNFFDLLTKIGIGGVLFFIPISNALIDSFVGFALLGFVGKKIIRPDFQWLKSKQNIFLALFFIFMSLSLINSGQYIEKSLVALLLKWSKFIGLSLIIQDSISKRRDLLVFVGIFLFSAGLVAISGITQFFWGVEFLRGKEAMMMKGGIRTITSSFSHCNGLGAYLVIPFTLCVAFLKSPHMLRLRSYLFILFLTIILAFCIFHTYSRGAWIGVFVALLTMLLISRRIIIISVVVIFASILFFIPEFRNILFSIFQSGGDSDRFKYWQVAVTMFKENPFLGKGLGTFMAYFSRYMPNLFVAYAHNCYLQILAESGIFSLIAFLGFVSLVIYKGTGKFFLKRDPILLGGICGLAGFLAHSFFEVSLYSLPLAMLFWLWIGIVSALSSGMVSSEK